VKRAVLAGAALVTLTTLAFAPSLTSPFTRYDDPLYVWNNLDRLKPSGWEGFALQFDSQRAWGGDFIEYFPLRDAVYWGLFQTYGLNPTPYHVVSLVFHLITSLLVWRFFSQIGLTARSAWLGALLFALHPVHIESVVWVAGMKDPMVLMFMMAGLCAYQSYRARPAAWKYGLTMVALVAAFHVKSIAVAMPVIMLGLELFVGQRERWTLIAKRLAGPFLTSGLLFAVILGIGRANNVIVPPHGGSWLSHAVIVAWAQVKYLKQALLPTSFRLIYCFEPPTGWGDPRLWAGVALLLAAGALVYAWRREPLRLFFIAIYVTAILPVSNLLPFPAIMADRYLYVPTLGTCGLLALLLTNLHPRLFVVVSATIALSLTAATASRAAIWQDEEALWEEPDLDPACVTDTSFPAAQSHILRYYTTKDRSVGLMALERAMISPGLKGVDRVNGCTMIIGAAIEAHELGLEGKALNFAKLATVNCSNFAQAWNAAMVVNLHKRLELAAGAATKAWRLQKTPETEALMWLTRLELGDSSAQAHVLRLSTMKSRLACEKIAQFAADVPTLAPALGEAIHNCGSVLSLPPPPNTLSP
jgi:hypothetical protein